MTPTRTDEDGGNAIVEFVFVAVAVLVPLVYLLVSVGVVQRAQAAVGEAARDVGRAYATSPDAPSAAARVAAASRLALAGAGLQDGEAPVFVPAGAGCDATPIEPTFEPGAEFAVCVRRNVDLPVIPTVLQGKGITVVGRYVVHLNEFRAAS